MTMTFSVRYRIDVLLGLYLCIFYILMLRHTLLVHKYVHVRTNRTWDLSREMRWEMRKDSPPDLHFSLLFFFLHFNIPTLPTYIHKRYLGRYLGTISTWQLLNGRNLVMGVFLMFVAILDIMFLNIISMKKQPKTTIDTNSDTSYSLDIQERRP